MKKPESSFHWIQVLMSSRKIWFEAYLRRTSLTKPLQIVSNKY